MSEKRALGQHLTNRDLYVEKTGPSDGMWKQRLLARFEKKAEVDLKPIGKKPWIRIVSIVMPLISLAAYALSIVRDTSLTMYVQMAMQALVSWIKAVSPWGNLVFGVFVLILTMLVVRRMGYVRGLMQ